MVGLGKLPRGLLALLGIQNMGSAPREMSEIVSPVLDISRLYLLNDMIQQTGIVNPMLASFNSLITIPAGQVWRIHALDAALATGVGVTGAVAAGVRMNNLTVSLTPTIALAASQQRRTPTGPCELWLPSGAELGVIGSEITGAPVATLQLLYSPYQA